MTTIDVTQKDIDEGKPGHCMLCPIALAAKRAFGSNMVVEVGYLLWAGNVHYPLPDTARRFMRAFDKGKLVKPFAFEVGEP